MPISHLAARASFPCPHCHSDVSGAITWLIDAAEPAAVGRLRNRQVNAFRCGQCGTPFAAPVPLLFIDAGRQLAIAQVPPSPLDADELAGALVARYLEAVGADDVDDWLLLPGRVETLEELRVAVSLGAPDPSDEDDLTVPRAAARYAVLQRAEGVAVVLDLLGDVTSEDAFLATLNRHPELVQPGRVRAVEALGRFAEEHEEPTIGAALLDLAALLRAHTPPEADDQPEEAADEVSPEVRDLLVAGDLSLADEVLERPDPRRSDEARRALQTVEFEDADRREGFVEHARLFGSLVEDILIEREMNDPAVDAGPPQLPAPPGLPEDAWAAFMRSGTADMAEDVLAEVPELVDVTAERLLAAAETAAIDRGDESAAVHFGMLRNALLVAGVLEDDDEEQEDDSWM